MEFTVSHPLGKKYQYRNCFFAGKNNEIFKEDKNYYVRIINLEGCYYLPIFKTFGYVKLLEKKGSGDSLLFINETDNQQFGTKLDMKVKLEVVDNLLYLSKIEVILHDYDTQSYSENLDSSISSYIFDHLFVTAVNKDSRIVIEYYGKKYTVYFSKLSRDNESEYECGICGIDSKIIVKNVEVVKLQQNILSKLDILEDKISNKEIQRSNNNLTNIDNSGQINEVMNHFNENERNPKIVLITGGLKSGKTTIAKEIGDKLAKLRKCELIYVSSSLVRSNTNPRGVICNHFTKTDRKIIILDDLELIIEYFSENKFECDIANLIRAFLKDNAIHDIIMTTSMKEEMNKLMLFDSVTFTVN